MSGSEHMNQAMGIRDGGYECKILAEFFFHKNIQLLFAIAMHMCVHHRKSTVGVPGNTFSAMILNVTCSCIS